jgi:hypothetical protein
MLNRRVALIWSIFGGWEHAFRERWLQGACLIAVLIVASSLILASALAWGPHHCKLAFPMVIGCALGSYEALAGGLIAAAAALIAGWFAWTAVQLQIDAEQKRAAADRVEVEQVLQADVDAFADGLAAIWRVLEGMGENEDPAVRQTKLSGVIYGIETIAKKSWLSTSRKMVTVLGWERRRSYEELFDGIERLGQFKDADSFDVIEALNAVRSLSYDFEIVKPECSEYFDGLFRRAGKAWDLGYTIERIAGVAD